MERKTRIKAVAIALTAVFLASIALASLASAASSNAAGTGTYQCFIIQKQKNSWFYLEGWETVLSLSMPYVSIPGWYEVKLDAHSYQVNTRLQIGIGVNSPSADASTSRYWDADTQDTERLDQVHTEEVFYLGAGAHTFYFRAGRVSGTTTCALQNSHITVTFFTDGFVSSVAEAEVGSSAVPPQ